MEGDFDNSLEHIEVILSGIDPLKATGLDGMPIYLLKSRSYRLSK